MHAVCNHAEDVTTVGQASSAHLALLKQHSGDDLIEEADKAEHGVVRQVLLRKLPLRSEQGLSATGRHCLLPAARVSHRGWTYCRGRIPTVISQQL